MNRYMGYINYYGSAHSDSIVTRDESAARAFLGGQIMK